MTERAAPIVLSAPSGTGKTTLAHRLVEDSPRFSFSVSATTRPPRDGERDGVDYRFMDRSDFERMAETGGLAEWAEVHGRLYGTPSEELERLAAEGRHAVLDIDVQGARQIRASVADARLIFVLPPGVGIMLARLTGRGTESRGEIARRLASAVVELDAIAEFDHVVVNDDLDRCVAEIRDIVSGGKGKGPEGHLGTATAYRSEIERVLEEEYRDVWKTQEER